jgi:hypothetical protein
MQDQEARQAPVTAFSPLFLGSSRREKSRPIFGAGGSSFARDVQKVNLRPNSTARGDPRRIRRFQRRSDPGPVAFLVPLMESDEPVKELRQFISGQVEAHEVEEVVEAGVRTDQDVKIRKQQFHRISSQSLGIGES